MKAALYKGIQNITVEDIPVPGIGPGELLIKIHAAAICGTDLRIYNYGHFKIKEGETRILGHELSGEIVNTATGEILNKIAEVAFHNVIHAEPLVVTRENIKSAILTADSLGKAYMKGEKLTLNRR
jgi:NADPH:quinone reductase-like Zn-dependent oxidoreductase